MLVDEQLTSPRSALDAAAAVVSSSAMQALRESAGGLRSDGSLGHLPLLPQDGHRSLNGGSGSLAGVPAMVPLGSNGSGGGGGGGNRATAGSSTVAAAAAAEGGAAQSSSGEGVAPGALHAYPYQRTDSDDGGAPAPDGDEGGMGGGGGRRWNLRPHGNPRYDLLLDADIPQPSRRSRRIAGDVPDEAGDAAEAAALGAGGGGPGNAGRARRATRRPARLADGGDGDGSLQDAVALLLQQHTQQHQQLFEASLAAAAAATGADIDGGASDGDPEAAETADEGDDLPLSRARSASGGGVRHSVPGQRRRSVRSVRRRSGDGADDEDYVFSRGTGRTAAALYGQGGLPSVLQAGGGLPLQLSLGPTPERRGHLGGAPHPSLLHMRTRLFALVCMWAMSSAAVLALPASSRRHTAL